MNGHVCNCCRLREIERPQRVGPTLRVALGGSYWVVAEFKVDDVHVFAGYDYPIGSTPCYILNSYLLLSKDNTVG